MNDLNQCFLVLIITLRATLRSSSLKSLSLITLDWRSLPSRPARGLLLTEMDIRTVGSSTVIGGSGIGVSLLMTVSPMDTSEIPVIITMSPDMTKHDIKD